MSGIDNLAYDAGFRKAGEVTTSTASEQEDNFHGLEVIPTRLMPEGWFGLRTEKGVTCVGPKGTFFVPAFDLEGMLNKAFEV